MEEYEERRNKERLYGRGRNRRNKERLNGRGRNRGNKECFSSAGLIVSASFGCFQSIL